jgi:hypothetical protein
MIVSMNFVLQQRDVCIAVCTAKAKTLGAAEIAVYFCRFLVSDLGNFETHDFFQWLDMNHYC